jgi:PIN domain nuclease of toxin-antitoxin system
MIVLDTHCWVWLVDEQYEKLSDNQMTCIDSNLPNLFISIVSCWEIAKKYQIGKWKCDIDIQVWLENSTVGHQIKTLDLTKKIIVESIRLPGNFHSDPMDQLIVATARVFDCILVTSDEKILHYPHVKCLR